MSNQDVTEQKKRLKEGFIGQRMIVFPPNIKRKLISNSLIRNFYLTAIGHYPKASHHDRERKAGSPEYILIYCLDGSGYINVAGTSHQLQPNNYFIIPKNVAHRYRSDEANPWSIYWVHFTGDHSEKIYERFAEQNGPEVRTLPYDESRINLFEQIYSILEHNFNEKEMEIVNIYLLGLISSMIYHKESNPSIYSADSISKSILHMKKHINEKFEIEELSAQQNISVSHYSRTFKQKTGFSPINYFNQLKVQKACQYLYFTDRNIKDICIELGFDDQYYFSRLFKKSTGVSPAKYKKIYKKGV